jgi:hypothetical protein
MALTFTSEHIVSGTLQTQTSPKGASYERRPGSGLDKKNKELCAQAALETDPNKLIALD